MEAFKEDEVLEVGKYYNVRHAVINIDSRKKYVPILGNPHKDAAFGVDFMHYHIDGRFTRGKRGAYDTDEAGITNGLVAIDKCKCIVIDVIIKRKKCKRLTTGINPPTHLMAPDSKYLTWRKSFVGKSCKGKKCPHLGTYMHECNGILVCPLHDLHGSIETELIIG